MKNPTPKPQTNADYIATLVRALINGGGRGSLTWFAARTNTDRSILRRRVFKSKKAIDELTLALYSIIIQSQAKPGEILTGETEIDGFIIGKRKDGTPAWRTNI